MSQSGKNVLVAAKVEATFNTAPTPVTGATQIRIKGGGLTLKRTPIQSEEIRSDGQSARARLGSREVTGSYTCEMSVGGHDMLFEAVMRSTWVAAVAITQAAMTSITTPTTSTIVAAAGSWITQGVRVGDVVTLTGHATTANNNLRLRVKAVSALTITVIGTPLTVDAVADATFTLTVLKKLKRATTPTKRSFYIEEYNQDIDLTEVYSGCRFISMKITGTPDGMATVEFGILGADGNPLASGASPFYTSPTLPTGLPLVFTDAVIAFGVPGSEADTVIATGFTLEYVIAAKTEAVIGATTSRDVFDNDAKLNGTITLIREDLAALTALRAETAYSFHVNLLVPGSAPQDCLGFFVPNVIFHDVGNQIGGDGAMMDTVAWSAGMKEGYSATGYDDTMLTISTSAA